MTIHANYLISCHNHVTIAIHCSIHVYISKIVCTEFVFELHLHILKYTDMMAILSHLLMT
jgi:hypothetical protein